jgi:hypothetical protein
LAALEENLEAVFDAEESDTTGNLADESTNSLFGNKDDSNSLFGDDTGYGFLFGDETGRDSLFGDDDDILSTPGVATVETSFSSGLDVEDAPVLATAEEHEELEVDSDEGPHSQDSDSAVAAKSNLEVELEAELEAALGKDIESDSEANSEEDSEADFESNLEADLEAELEAALFKNEESSSSEEDVAPSPVQAVNYDSESEISEEE